MTDTSEAQQDASGFTTLTAAFGSPLILTRMWSWRYGVIFLTGFVGAVASVGMFLAIGVWQARVAELRFTSLARDHLQTINSGLSDATDLLYSIRAYFESLDHRPGRTEYQAFSRSLRQRVVGLRDTGWAPRVSGADRDKFEREVQATGFPDFQIIERDASGKMVRAKERAEYFPILYSDPGDINRPILGFDLTSESMRRRVIERARATDRPAATPPVKLINIQRPNGGVMSFIPVTAGFEEGRGQTVEVVPRQIQGIALGAFETAAMIENILRTKLNLLGLDLYVFDPNGLPDNRLIYWHSANGKPAPDEAALLAERHWSGSLDLIDQKWGVIFAPTDAFEAGVANWTPFAALVGGLVMTASLVGFLWFSVRRTQQLERLTISLNRTTDELRRNGDKLDRMARHDALTGLANRVAFRDDMASALRRVRRGQGMAVLYLDLDRFKEVNDTLGHPVGDRLLCEVADRMRATVREVDTIARVGGDEFAIVQSGAEQPRSAEALAQRLLEAISRPYEIGNHSVVVGVSIGITLADRDDLNVDELPRRADMALYAAKRDGRGTWRWFEPTMELDAQVRRGLEMDLRHAIEHQEFEVYYQPQVTIADRQIRGFEALLRWHHPQRGLVLPGDFIRCAEETGLIVPIGELVLRQALSEAARWPAGVRVSVNLSPRQMVQANLADTIETLLATSGQIGARLELEITENALVQHYDAARFALKRLRAIGVRISMDDFGTGYASLRHLRSFKFDRIKIDQSFIADMTESAEGASIVRAILQLASNLNITVTAEGVETTAQLEQLATDGCGEAQGYLLSPPRPASEVPFLLDQFGRSPTTTERGEGETRERGDGDA